MLERYIDFELLNGLTAPLPIPQCLLNSPLLLCT